MKQIYSIGVDLGTSTSEVILSRLTMEEELGPSLLPITRIVKKEVIYRSPIIFTPVTKNKQIDCEKIKEFIKSTLKESNITKEQIQTGAVIITGETARKENAKEVSITLSKYLGDFVVATAGPNLESVLAGYGANSAELSKTEHSRVINLDIGGGTLNAAVFDCGELIGSFAMDIGGRLVKINRQQSITYISERIQFLIDSYGIDVKIGEKANKKALEALFYHLANSCVEACGLKPISKDTKRLYITEGYDVSKLAAITISGGVGECFYKEQDDFIYGDCGPILGRMLRQAFAPYKGLIRSPKERIRATVIGAGSHSMSISGSTIGYEENILPKKNIPIIKSEVEYKDWNTLYEKTKQQFMMYEEEIVGLAIKGVASPGYERLCALGENIIRLYDKRTGPIIVLVKEDYAKALSQIIRLKDKKKRPVICLDKIICEAGDYIDIGRPVGSAVPVVIKTLIYST